ncbi:MAG: beta-hydroxyacyl-ACP dehydratase [Candidatus Symbiothrix sp.]|jgi:3-hydroxyacyl-[acyl-carrier-protein] dehydratase|nr:beta-hydroxyacyl-ACP dehydratase [Candidatus Symbiothrix sp.]
MKLLDDFYTIKQERGEGTEFEYVLSLNKEHFIYKSHFPGNPITPGVCLIQICKELMERQTGETLFLQKIHNVKFLSVIDPRVVDTIQVSFSKISAVEDGYKLSVLIHRDTTQFAKLSLYLTMNN